MKTSTLALIAVAAVGFYLYSQSAAAATRPSTVYLPSVPQVQATANPGGDTLGDILRVIKQAGETTGTIVGAFGSQGERH